jgi:hypothetical protein
MIRAIQVSGCITCPFARIHNKVIACDLNDMSTLYQLRDLAITLPDCPLEEGNVLVQLKV